eukprot:CAMPEP_0178385866 /NCGR_PEP_ID=MMETSP0689_2-20121128/8252_1 /TAXON_ID=160604 /ORGANISM="Amphidinium massartii, Strain CS-259" /LENGTH=673 /DNA_ID=CAMNT_0020006159 /DNA_START=10 /DNA_END=2032 /DNA_ORIENTATION=+
MTNSEGAVFVTKQAPRRQHDQKTHRGGGNKGKGDSQQQGQTRKVTCPWINQMIIQTAKSGNVFDVLLRVEEVLSQMNLVNLSTALHRIAKLVSLDTTLGDKVRETHTVHNLLEASVVALQKASAKGSTATQCQAICNICWAMATLQVLNAQFVETAVGVASARVEAFKPFELPTVLWSMAKLHTIDSYVGVMSAPLFELALQHILRNSDLFAVRAISTTAWAAGAVGATRDLHGLCGQFAQVLIPRLSSADPQEISFALTSFASLRYWNEEFWIATLHAAESCEFRSTQLANICWAMWRLAPGHTSVQQACLRLLPQCQRCLAMFKPSELTTVLTTYAKCCRTEIVEASEEGEKYTFPLAVLEFFQTAVNVVIKSVQGLNLHAFPERYFALLVHACVSAGLGVSQMQFFDAVGRAVLTRISESRLEDGVVLLLLQSLLQASPIQAVSFAVRALAADAVTRTAQLSDEAFQTLSYICASVFPDQKLINQQAKPTGMQSVAAVKKCQLVEFGHSQEHHLRFVVQRNLCSTPSAAVAASFMKPMVSPPSKKSRAHGVQSPDSGSGSSPERLDAYEVGSEATKTLRSRLDQVYEELQQKATLPRPIPTQLLEVKNTFIDVRDDSFDDPENGPLVLPPPLDCIPWDVSSEELNDYRQDYQRFRAGWAMGARGEVFAKV